MKILLTGATGFIGSNLAKAFAQKKHELIITGHNWQKKLPDFKGRAFPTFIGLDWKKIGQIDALFHQAAICDTTNLDKQEMLLVNTEAPKKLFRQAIAHGCKHIIYASSIAVYGDVKGIYQEHGPTHPLNPYALSKKKLDTFARRLANKYPQVKIIGLRYVNVYGPGEAHKAHLASLFFKWARQMQKNQKPRVFGDGEQKRDYIYIKDVVRANRLALRAKKSCILNICSGELTSFNELLTALNKALGKKVKPLYVPNPYQGRYQSRVECASSLAKKMIGFKASYSLKKGIKDYLNSGGLTV